VVIAMWAWLFPELRHAGELTAIGSSRSQGGAGTEPSPT